MAKPNITFSIHDFDRDGDIIEPGVFLNFGQARIRVAGDLIEFRTVIAHLESMAVEIEENYPEFQQ